MHWGVRKERSRVRPSSTEHKKASELRKKRTSQLTNKQLKSVNERMNLEQNYHRMNPTTIKRGLAAVSAIMGVAGMGFRIYDMYNSPGGKAARSTGKAAMEQRRQLKKINRARKLVKDSGQLKLFP